MVCSRDLDLLPLPANPCVNHFTPHCPCRSLAVLVWVAYNGLTAASALLPCEFHPWTWSAIVGNICFSSFVLISFIEVAIGTGTGEQEAYLRKHSSFLGATLRCAPTAQPLPAAPHQSLFSGEGGHGNSTAGYVSLQGVSQAHHTPKRSVVRQTNASSFIRISPQIC